MTLRWAPLLAVLWTTLALTAAPASAQTTLVSNASQSGKSNSGHFRAQAFTTGDQGATLSDVQAEVNASSASDNITAAIRENSDSNRPGDLLASLTTSNLTANAGTVTFTAPANTTLAANTTYWVMFNEGLSGSRRSYKFTSSNGQTGQSGWTIGDSSLTRFRESDDWSSDNGSMVMTVRGTLAPATSPSISISGGSAVTEGTAATFTVTASPAPATDLTVSLSVSESSNGDYVADADTGTKTVTITANETSATYSVPTVADTTDEANGQVTVTVSSGTGYTVGAPASASVTVNDNDPVLTIAAVAATVTEGTAAQFTVTASSAPTTNLTVSLSVSEAAGSDYVAAANEGAQTVTIAANQTSATYAVPTVADSTDEPNGTVTVAVTAVAGYGVGTTGSASVTVNDDDPEITITAVAATVTEGAAAQFTVTASSAPTTTLTVSLSVSEATGSDYVAAADEGAKTVTIAANQTSATYSVPTVDDSTDEEAGTVTVAVTAVAGYGVGTASSASVTVNDNDEPATTEPALPAGCDMTEGPAAAFTRVTATDSSITVTYGSLSDHATGPNKVGWLRICRPVTNGYQNFIAKTLFFPVSQTTDTIADLVAGTDYWVTVASFTTGVQRSPWHYIRTTGSAETQLPSISISGGQTVTEGASATFVIDATIAPDDDLSVSLTVSEATGHDCVAEADTGTRTVTILADETSATLFVPTVDDNVDDPTNCTVTALVTSGTGYTVGTTSSASVTVNDNDVANNYSPVFSSPATMASVNENSPDGTPVVTIAATDDDAGDTITYTLDNTADTVFAIAANGAITVQVDEGSALDHEAKSSYTVTVTASDTKVSVTHTLTITVTDVLEAPAAPAAPTVEAASTTSVTVSWTAPDTTGIPPITDYDVQYRQSGTTAWTDAGYDGTGTSTTIASLTAGTTYEVQVKARNNEDASDWSDTGSGATNLPERATITTVAITSTPVHDADANGTPDTYLRTDDIDVTVTYDRDVTWNVEATNAQIRIRLTIGTATKVATLVTGGMTSGTTSTLTFRYRVAAGDRDTDGLAVTPASQGGDLVLLANAATLRAGGRGARRQHAGLPAQATHLVDGRKRRTAPGAPAAPDVTSASATSLTVSWSAPSTLGSATAITDYDLRYYAGTTAPANNADWIREGEAAGPPDPGTATSATITGLTTGTAYLVQVRAEGDGLEGSWSASGRGTPTAATGPAITIAAVAATVTEGTAAEFTVTADSAPTATLTVKLTVSESDDGDYVDSGDEGAKTVTIAANQTSATYAVDTQADATDEPDGTVTVEVTAGTGYTVGATASASVTVTDDAPADTAAPDFGTATVANQSYVVNTAITDLTLPAATGGDGTLSYALTPALPAGLSFSASTRILSGTPTARQAATTYAYTVTDADTNTAATDADTLTFTLAVTSGCAGSTAVGGSMVTSGGLVDDCEALLASEATLVGAGTALNWDPGTALASWDGVTVTSTRVAQLTLSASGLSGSIPPELGRLSSLTVLTLASNTLTGSIPPELGRLSSLTFLDLSANTLTGSIPPELGNLSSLTHLNLAQNTLTGSIPKELGNLSSLIRLNLYANALMGSIPPELGNLSSLTYLRLHANALTGSIPPELGNLSSLTVLWLYANALTGSIPPELGRLSSLTHLWLYANALTGCIPAGLPSASGDFVYNPQQGSRNLPVCPGVPVLMLTPGDAEIAASWTAPAGGTPTDYDLNYKLSSVEAWSDAAHTGTGTSATIASLTNGSAYDVRVRANTATDTGTWSESQSATPRDAAPTVTAASVNGDKLTLTFNEALAAAANLANSAFTVKKTPDGGTEQTVSLSATAPAISGSTVVLTLAAAVLATDTAVKVSYAKPTTGSDNTLKDAAGNETESFTDQAVTNNTGAGPTITISGGAAVTEGAAAQFTVTASAAPTTTLTVNLTVSESANGDYVAEANEGAKTVTITATETSATYAVDTEADSTDEPNGSVTVTVTAGTGYTVGAPASASVTVNDDDPAANTAPVFTNQTTTKTLPENSPADTAVATITATDADNDTITYSLDSTSDAAFDIDPATGAITVQADDSLNFEAATSHTLTVTASDGTDSTNHVLTVTVTDVDTEAPGRPAQPTVTGASKTSVTVRWVAPANTGPAITGYDVQYKLSTVTTWSAHTFTGTGTTTTITNLTTDATYDVQVKAKNAEGESAWSPTGSGDTQANAAPMFTSQPATASVAENNVANALVTTITATDANSDPLTYSLADDDPAVFRINAATGAITVPTANALNFEVTASYEVTVTATDTSAATATHDLTITVTDVDGEAPAAPAAPMVTGASKTSVTVNWKAPANTGPAINDYDVQYKLSTADDWESHDFTGTDTSTTITDLTTGASYQVQVKAKNDEGDSDWSPTGSGVTLTNVAPVFSAEQPTAVSVDENNDANASVTTVVATDANTEDTVTYSLDTASDAVFDIASNGAITIPMANALNFEARTSYTITVTASDGLLQVTHNVTVTVDDVLEPPDAPGPPTVTGANKTSVTVTWTAPDTTGRPDLTDYDVQYRLSSASDGTAWSSHTFTGTGRTTTISSLTVGTGYDVQVLARNAEGDSAWSTTGSGSTIANAAPVFTSQPRAASVAENNPANAPVTTVVATDANTEDTVAYSLDTAARAVFSINTATGAITVPTANALNHEATSSYTVTVTASDGAGGSTDHVVTVTVTDVQEKPNPPAAPTVTPPEGESTTSVTVSWVAPNTGGPPITDYDLWWRPMGQPTWTIARIGGGPEPGDPGYDPNAEDPLFTGTSFTLTGLVPGTTYLAQVRATTDEGTSDFSPTGSGATRSPDNAAPVFTNQPATASVDENNVANAPVVTITATDADNDALTYTLDDESNVFAINAATGAITVRAANTLDHEAQASYSTTVRATDGTATVSHTLTINVNDLDEPPDPPEAPTVEAASQTSVTVSWDAPDVTGRPPLTDYDVRYRRSTETAWSPHAFEGTDTTTTIADLTVGATYQVQVLAWNEEGASAWSATGSGATSANNPPVFTNQPVTASVPENSPAGRAVETITATDADDDTLEYSLDADAATVFAIDPATGAITVRAADTLNYEARASYTVTVTASDGTARRTHVLTITLTDEDGEAPEAPAAPLVTGATPTSVTVSWTEPANPGPPITDYDVQYRAAGDAAWRDAGYDGVTTTTTIEALTEGVSYEAQVRARNDEGESAWSVTGSGATSANSAPVFTDQPATASVPENSPDGTPVVTITATDVDVADTLAYALDPDADAVFDIDPATGAITVQVEAGAALNHEAQASYTVTVTVSDGTVEVSYNLTITVDDVDGEAPDAPDAPVVTGATPTSVTVRWTAPANPGPPLTDYDVQYRVSGTTPWTDAGYDGLDISTTLTTLTPGTTYEVQVKAQNDEGESAWSATGRGATGATGTPPPAPVPPPAAGRVAGAMVTLEFTEVLDTQSVPDPTDFIITLVDAVAQPGARLATPVRAAQEQEYRVTAVAIQGSRLVLTVSPPIPAGRAIHVRYTPGATPLRTAAGQPVQEFMQALSDAPPPPPDATAPTVQGATVTGTVLTLTYDEALDPAAQPPGSAFTVTVDGTPVPLAGTTPVDIAGATVTLTLAVAVTDGQAVTVSYTAPTAAGATPLQDAAGNAAPAFRARDVTNQTPPEAPPVARAGADRRVLPGARVTLDGSASTDPDGDDAALTFAWTQLPGGERVMLQHAETAHPAFTAPEPTGPLTFRLTVTDASGLDATDTVTVTVVASSPARQRLLTRTLAVMGAQTLGSALDVLGTRFTTAEAGTRLTVAGRPLTFGAPAATPARPDPACVADAGPAACDPREMARRAAAAGPTPALSFQDLLQASSFTLALGATDAAGAGTPAWTFWGRGATGAFGGRPEAGARFNGQTRTGWLGLDARAAAWVAGLAVSYDRTEADYGLTNTATSDRGDLETTLTTVYPYGRWAVTDTLDVRTVLGAGRGTARHRLAEGAQETSDLALWLGSVGLRQALPAVAGFTLAARADASLVHLETDKGPQALDNLTAQSWRGRLGVAASRSFLLDDGTAVAPFGELVGRYDGGDGFVGTGLEVAGGLRYTATRFQLEARGRFLVVHAQAGAQERGVSVTARLNPDANGQGLSLTLAPRWGAATGHATTLWRHDLPQAAGGAAADTAALAAQFGYGLALARGVLTPFAQADLTGPATRQWRVGTRFEIRRSALMLELAGVRREHSQATPEQGIRLDLTVRF